MVQEEKEIQLPGDRSLPTDSATLAAMYDQSEDKHKYSIEDFFRLPEKTAYQLSPDGTHLSFLAPYERRQNIFVQKIGSTEKLRLTAETSRNMQRTSLHTKESEYN